MGQKKYTKLMHKIDNIMNRPRLPKLGVVRLGTRDVNGKPTEIKHFMIDTDPAIAQKTREIYGEAPTVIDVAFYTDAIDEAYRCTYQRWGKSIKKGTPYLACEGNGQVAIESNGGVDKERLCPCPALGKDCKKTTVLKILLPKISLTGYFILATKSESNAQTIQTAIDLVYRMTGGLIMRPLRLMRTEGYAEVNGFKVKKYFLALIFDETAWKETRVQKREIENDKMLENAEKKPLMQIRPVVPPFEEDSTRASIYEEKRLKTGRAKLKEKIKLCIKDPRAECQFHKLMRI
ncbi:MAG: hypothetical protein HZA15_14880 [Nitrospirae bacterium]|nr:hypothetical protein [Nitrospirota bacterium]